MDIKNKIKSLLRQTVLDFVNGDFQEIQAKLIDELTINDIKKSWIIGVH